MQLSDGDEVGIVDDCSTDNTIDQIRDINDSRIKLYVNNKNMREVYSFGHALELAKNSIIFLSDQDDIWRPNKVSTMLKAIELSGCSLVTSNFEWFDDNDQVVNIPFDGVSERTSKLFLKNIIDIYIGRTNYFGCAMAMNSSIKRIVLPIPKFVESHDLWIAFAGNILRSNVHLDAQLFKKRKHLSNLTSTVSTRSIYKKLISRIIFTISIFILLLRINKLKK
jgi:glycosyltransferase involved in cell wall biosynthesis